MDELDTLLDGLDSPSDSPTLSGSATSIRKQPNWPGVIVVVALVAIVTSLILSRLNRDQDDTSPVKVDKPHVVILEETSDHDKLPADQLAIFTSVPIREFYDENEVVYRKYDVDDDVSKESKTLQELREMVSEVPPCVIVAKGSKATQFKLPKDPDAMMKKIKQIIGVR